MAGLPSAGLCSRLHGARAAWLDSRLSLMGQVPDLRLLGFGERQLNNLLGTDTRKVEQALARMTA